MAFSGSTDYYTMSLIQRIDALLPQPNAASAAMPVAGPMPKGWPRAKRSTNAHPAATKPSPPLPTCSRCRSLHWTPGVVTHRPKSPYSRGRMYRLHQCIQACPVDAIVGAAKLMHTVIASECTGCDLCLAPCPVDCIDLLPLPDKIVPIVGGLAHTAEQLDARAKRRDHARHRHEQRNARLQREEARRQAERMARSQRAASNPTASGDASDPIKAAIERVKAQKAAHNDAALKQAKIAAAMSRAQLNKPAAHSAPHRTRRSTPS